MRNAFREVPAFLLATALLLASGTAAAQSLPRRTLQGQVLDESDKALATAIVRLKNMTTKEETTVVTNKEGRYQFAGLDAKVDYELYAESGEQKSRLRKVSQFDPRERIVINLKLMPAEKARGEAGVKEEKKEKD